MYNNKQRMSLNLLRYTDYESTKRDKNKHNTSAVA